MSVDAPTRVLYTAWPNEDMGEMAELSPAWFMVYDCIDLWSGPDLGAEWFAPENETTILKRAFGDHAKKLAISSTKSMHGHMMGASGAVELLVTVMAIRNGIVPPTINYREPDSECDLD